MKTLKASFWILLLALVVAGCGGVEKIMPRQDGTWDVTTTYRTFVASTLDSSWTDPVITFTFDKAGTFTYKDSNGTHTDTWTVNPDGNIVILCEATVGSLLCVDYLVEESAKDSQKWLGKIVGAVNGSYTEIELNLKRK